MKALLLSCTLALVAVASVNARAADTQKQQSQARIETQTSSTGVEYPIAYSVSPCSEPDVSPVLLGLTMIDVESNFTYTACREYVTMEVEVTGKFWNESTRELSETARKSYRMEQTSKGASQYLYAPQSQQPGSSSQGIINLANYMLVRESMIQSCETQRNFLLSQQRDAATTPCQQQPQRP